MPYQTKTDAALTKAREELAALFRQREELEVRIAKQQRRVAALVTLVDDTEATDQLLGLNLGGLTDAIRTTLRTAGSRGLTTSEVTARLDQLFFPVNDYKNFRASLGTVLKRLIASGEVRKSAQDGRLESDRTVYVWVGAIKNRVEKTALSSRTRSRALPAASGRASFRERR